LAYAILAHFLIEALRGTPREIFGRKAFCLISIRSLLRPMNRD
jgi:hypothetical protein